MSPELETLDQLLGGDLSLAIIRTLYPSPEQFQRGINGLLSNGDVSIIAADGTPIPQWRWQDVLDASLKTFKLRITPQGVSRIK